jgi:MFS family permease
MSSIGIRSEAAPPEMAPVPHRGRVMRSLWVASVFGGLGQALAGSAGALLVRDLGSEALAGLPQAMLVIGAGGSALALSALTRRRGRGTALTAGAAIATMGCLVVTAAGLVPSLPLILAGTLLIGSGQAAVMLGRYAVADLGPESARGRLMATVLLATTAGSVAGPNLLAPSAGLAHRLGVPELLGPFVLAGGSLLLMTAALATGLRGLRPGMSTAAATSRQVEIAGLRGRLASALTRRQAGGMMILGAANLVMVAVMTMAPVHLHHLGTGLTAIGAMISAHIAAMFAPAPLSGWLTDRFGPRPVATGAGAVLAAAGVLAAVGSTSATLLTVAVILLGLGWNLGLVSGSVLLTAGLPAAERPRTEGWGEAGMSVAAAGGGAASGVVVATGGYPVLGLGGAVVAVAMLAALGWASIRRAAPVIR